MADQHVGVLSDALLDPEQPFAVRRRVARVFAGCHGPRAVDSLLLGLGDMRFEVRYHCARSLASIHARVPDLAIDRDTVLRAALREVNVSRAVWEGHRILDASSDAGAFMDRMPPGRGHDSLAHVFTLLSLVLTAEPIRIAFRGLHTDDEHLRGTALEYLEGVLPGEIRERLWPFLDDGRAGPKPTRDREAVTRDLLRSHPSIELNLQKPRSGVRT